MKCLKELEESQWWLRDKILELQNQRLRQLIRHAYDNVPYYHRVFNERGLNPEDIKSSDDLVKLPVLTKRLIRNNFDDLIARNFPAKEIVPSSTGGSTGEPLMFYSTKDAIYNWGFAAGQRALRWAGYKIGDKCALIHHARYPFKSRMEKFRQIAAEFFERIIFIDPRKLSAKKLPLVVKKLEDFQPLFIRSFPSALHVLAQFLEKREEHNLKLKAIIASGEQLHDYQRDLFSEIFRCEIYNHYSSYEAWTIASECPAHLGYHVAAENMVIEIVDDDGKPVPTGNEGRILVTSLHNHAMPFIRYDIGDTGVVSDKTCPCGRGLLVLTKLIGKTTDLILTKDGGYISGLALPRKFFASWGVEQFQIVQESYEHVAVNLVLNRKYPQTHRDNLTKEIINQYQPTLGEDMNITVKFVDQIPITSAGKRRVVVSNLQTGD